MPKLTALFLVAATLIIAACRKDNDKVHTPVCQQFAEGILAEDRAVVRNDINLLIQQLSRREHTEANLHNLVATLNKQCAVTATVLCYNCIYTLPGQSEIRIVSGTGSASKTQVIDVTSDKDDNMIFAGMHD